MILNENVDRKIIPIAGGKGGVGKSVLAVNIALSMAMYGKKVVLVDLDLGGSNVHTLLGEKNNRPGIGNLVSGPEYGIDDLVAPTRWKNLLYVPGDVLVYGLGEIDKELKTKVVKNILDIDADYIIIDLGGGTNFTVVDFFLISNSGLIVTTPQNTAVMNAYSFLKNYVFRFLRRAFASNGDVTEYLQDTVKEKRPEHRKTVTQVVAEIGERDSLAGEKAEAFLDVIQPKLLLNKVRGPVDVALAEGLRDLCSRNLSINLECLGTVMNSDEVDESVELQNPFIVDYPDGVVTAEIHRIAQKIIQSGQFPAMPLELDYYSDSFELAHIETENDMAAMQDEAGRDQESGDYDVDQLLELIKIQQSRIQELQGTLRMLSMGQF